MGHPSSPPEAETTASTVARAFALLIVLFVAGACSNGGDARSSVELATATATPVVAAATATPAPTATPTATADSAALAAPSCDERAAIAADLATKIEEAMADYPGDWGFAFIDIRCDKSVAINPDYAQYAASAGKIISIVAVLQAVERGALDFADVEPALLNVFHYSLDEDADYLDTLITAADLDAVLEQAGVTTSRISGSWRQTHFNAPDFARIWAAILDGTLLGPEYREFVLEQSSMAEIPNGFETFPDGSFEHPVLRYGQKAGYYVSDGVPYFLVGAGYLLDPASGDAFIPVILIRTELVDLLDPQRRAVFPLVVHHVEQMLGLPSTGN